MSPFSSSSGCQPSGFAALCTEMATRPPAFPLSVFSLNLVVVISDTREQEWPTSQHLPVTSVSSVGVPPCARRDPVLVRPRARRCPSARRAVNSALLVQLPSVSRARCGLACCLMKSPAAVPSLLLDAPAHKPKRVALSPSPSSRIFSNRRRQLSDCAPPSPAQFFQPYPLRSVVLGLWVAFSLPLSLALRESVNERGRRPWLRRTCAQAAIRLLCNTKWSRSDSSAMFFRTQPTFTSSSKTVDVLRSCVEIVASRASRELESTLKGCERISIIEPAARARERRSYSRTRRRQVSQPSPCSR